MNESTHTALRSYIECEVALLAARREGRPPNVRPMDVVELAAFLEKQFGGDVVSQFDSLIARTAYRAITGKAPPEEADDRADDAELRARFNDRLIDLITEYVETFAKLHQKRSAAAGTDNRSGPLSYRGTWKPDGEYRPGDLVTRDGVLWHANEPTRDKPGTSKAFTMMHKNLTKAA